MLRQWSPEGELAQKDEGGRGCDKEDGEGAGRGGKEKEGEQKWRSGPTEEEEGRKRREQRKSVNPRVVGTGECLERG